MPVPLPNIRIGQVWRKSEQNGIELYTYFARWQSEPLAFCSTRVQGSIALPTNKCDPDEDYKTIATYQQVKDLMADLLFYGGGTLCEPLMPLDEIEAKVSANQKKLEQSLAFINRNKPIDKTIKRL